MKRLFKKINLDLNFWTMSLVSLVLVGLSFAIYLPSLGYYFDDWPQIYSMVVRGLEGIKTYFAYDSRPFGWVTEWLLFKLWGTNAVAWHLFNYLMHWLTGIVIYLTLTKIWPASRKTVAWMVMLFAVYPAFDQQSAAIIYTGYRVSFLFFWVSLLLMIQFVTAKKYRFLWLVIGLLLNAVNLFTVEYFIGLELIRPFILWFILEDKGRKKISRVLLNWLPWLLLTAAFAAWRLFFMENLRSLSLFFFSSLAASPKATILFLFESILKTFIKILFGVWYATFDPAMIDFASAYRIIALGLVLLVFVSLLVLLIFNQKRWIHEENRESNPLKQQLWLGAAGIFAGSLPVWLIMRSYGETVSVYVDRFALPIMWAAALLLTALLTRLFREHMLRRNLILALLIALAGGKNFSDTNSYKWSTTMQNRIFYQLKWRAPGLRPNTTIVAARELFANMGAYEIGFKLNLLYPTSQPMPQLDYYFGTTYKLFPRNINDITDESKKIKAQRWYAEFEANGSDSLVVNWSLEPQDCLWVLSINDRYNPLLYGNTAQALAGSDLWRILPGDASFTPDPNLFGREDHNTWCYFYQSADLARQNGDWAQVVSLYEQAKAAGFSPANGVELIPFIEGFARNGQADVAANLNVVSLSLTENMRDYLCDTWNRMAKEITNDPLFDSEYQAFSQQDRCWEVK
jgi:hypothetical protein